MAKKTSKKRTSKRNIKNTNKYRDIKDDLIKQLTDLDKFDAYYLDLVEDYMFFYEMKIKMQDDININGFRISLSTGNGHKSEKPNECVQNLLKYNAQMLKILSELGLQAPVDTIGGGVDDTL